MTNLRQASEAHSKALAALKAAESHRDRLIVKARASGMTLRAIAAEAGVTFARVDQILKREKRPNP